MRMPVKRSCMYAFTRAIRTRMSRYAVRILARNRKAATKTSGSTLNVTSASCQFIRSIAATMKTSVNTSPNTVTTPELKSSLSVSTSLVMRVIRRPIGFLS